MILWNDHNYPNKDFKSGKDLKEFLDHKCIFKTQITTPNIVIKTVQTKITCLSSIERNINITSNNSYLNTAKKLMSLSYLLAFYCLICYNWISWELLEQCVFRHFFKKTCLCCLSKTITNKVYTYDVLDKDLFQIKLSDK